MERWILPLQLLVLTLSFWAESLLPFFPASTNQARLNHAKCNLSLGLLNGFILVYGVAFLSRAAAIWAEAEQFGILHWVAWPAPIRALAAFLLLDAWAYAWHRCMHKARFLWKFHQVHHCDRMLDATTAYRFHFGEVLFSSLIKIIVLPLLGVELRQWIWYELILGMVLIFQHGNIALPPPAGPLLGRIIVTPAMHRLHHSDQQEETHSNYGFIFPAWDRMFGTYQPAQPGRFPRYGLPGLEDPLWQTVPGLLTLPTTGR